MPQSASAAAFTLQHEVPALQTLFDEIRQGRVRGLREHRFRWSEEDMRRLFESVQGGYPIGGMLFWEPSERIRSSDGFGPVELPPPAGNTLILDGYQRLATLFGITHSTPAQSAQGDPSWALWYDLEEGAFAHLPPEGVEPHHLPLGSLLGTTPFLQFVDRLKGHRPEEAPLLIQRAERLARQVRSYRVQVTRLRGGAVENALEAVARLDTPNLRHAPEQLAAALAPDRSNENL